MTRTKPTKDRRPDLDWGVFNPARVARIIGMTRIWQLLALLAFSSAIACGGGSGGGETTPTDETYTSGDDDDRPEPADEDPF
ncbi:MAG: hypothetical protein ACI9KE_001586 [Polyangiales bacterium]